MDDRYGAGLKGLNISGGTNRFKFEGKQARAKRVDVDVIHKVRAEGFLDADKAQEPDADGGSFFQQELGRCKELNVTSPFKRFYYKVVPGRNTWDIHQLAMDRLETNIDILYIPARITGLIIVYLPSFYICRLCPC